MHVRFITSYFLPILHEIGWHMRCQPRTQEMERQKRPPLVRMVMWCSRSTRAATSTGVSRGWMRHAYTRHCSSTKPIMEYLRGMMPAASPSHACQAGAHLAEEGALCLHQRVAVDRRAPLIHDHGQPALRLGLQARVLHPTWWPCFLDVPVSTHASRLWQGTSAFLRMERLSPQ